MNLRALILSHLAIRLRMSVAGGETYGVVTVHWFEFKIMKYGSRTLGLLLIAALVIATWTTGALTAADLASRSLAGLPAPPVEHPAGCHAHGGKSLPDSQLPHSPRPAPASHQCCLTGHNVAAVQASHPTPPSRQWTRVTLQIVPALIECSYKESDVLMVLSADPPGMTPLRI